LVMWLAGFLTREMAEFIVPMTKPAGPELPALPALPWGGVGAGTGPLEVGVSRRDLVESLSFGADFESEPVSGKV